MAHTVVAEQTVDNLDSQKHGRDLDRLSIICILEWPHGNDAADREIHRARRVVVAGSGDHLLDQKVVRLVLRDRVFEIEIESVPTLREPIDVCGRPIQLEQVTEEHCPLVGEFGRANEFVDQRIPLGGIGIVDEINDLVRLWDASGEIHFDASEKFCIGTERRRFDACALDAAEDMLIDEVVSRRG